jgi:ankyrin repeat protein
MWIYLAPNTLQVVELQHALAVKPGDTAFDPEGLYSLRTLVECCLGLVVIETETSTIRLTHFTLDEYLDKHWKDSDLFPDGHAMIAGICLTYLQFDHVLPPPPSDERLRHYHIEDLRESLPLLPYAVNNVGGHVKMTSDQDLARQCITIFERKEIFQLFQLLLDNKCEDYGGYDEHDKQKTILYWAADFGCTSVVELLKSSAVNMDARTEMGYTPLVLAARNGHEAVVRVLLDIPGVDVNSSDKYDATVLSLAAHDGHEAVVRLLLNVPGVDVNLSDKDGDAPLSAAVLNGHEAVVRLLLNVPGVDVNSSNKYGNTPLSLATLNGHEAVVRLLLNVPCIDVNSPNNNGSTPLSLAARDGHEAVVRLLLDVPGADTNSSNNNGDTPLSLAARKCHEAIVRLLLNVPGVDVNSSNQNGDTPLSFAASRGHEAIVRVLLNVPSVDINLKKAMVKPHFHLQL